MGADLGSVGDGGVPNQEFSVGRHHGVSLGPEENRGGRDVRLSRESDAPAFLNVERVDLVHRVGFKCHQEPFSVSNLELVGVHGGSIGGVLEIHVNLIDGGIEGLFDLVK